MYKTRFEELEEAIRASPALASSIRNSAEYRQATIEHSHQAHLRNNMPELFARTFPAATVDPFVQAYDILLGDGQRARLEREFPAAVMLYPLFKEAQQIRDSGNLQAQGSLFARFRILLTQPTGLAQFGGNYTLHLSGVRQLATLVQQRQQLEEQAKRDAELQAERDRVTQLARIEAEARIAAESEARARLAAQQVNAADPAGSIIVVTPAPPVVAPPSVVAPTPAPVPVAPPPSIVAQPAVQQTIQQAAAAVQQQSNAADGLTKEDLQAAIAQAVAAAEASRPAVQGATPAQVEAAIAQAVAAVKSEASQGKTLTVEDIKSVVASAVSRAPEKTASEVANTPTVAEVAAQGSNWFTSRNAGLPNWAWLLIGLLVLSGIGGGIWYATKEE